MMLMVKRLAQLLALAGLLLPTAYAATTFTNLDQKSGWESCSKCAGKAGNGPTAPYSMKQGVSSPSMDGASAQFNLGGTTPYSNALWWKQLGANAGAANFVYDLYFYMKNPRAAQALEFDVNQSRYGKKHIFGTECDFKGSHTWHVYDPYNRRWVHTSIACPVPQAYQWHHVTLEFQRTSGDKTGFVSVTVNGKKHYFNRSYQPRATSAKEINVAFQMDGNGQQTDYSVWVDKVKLTYW